MVSKTFLIGNLGSDPEMRTMNNGSNVVNVSLATTETWKDKQGNKQSATEWHRLVVYSPLAEVFNNFLKKGSKVYVCGKNKTRKWTDNNGVEKYTTEVVIREMQMLDSKPQGQQQNQGYQDQYPGQSANGPTGAGQDDFIESDIPF